jgi:hypothetical protein
MSAIPWRRQDHAMAFPDIGYASGRWRDRGGGGDLLGVLNSGTYVS